MKISGARIIVEFLKRQGVDTLFAYPGGSVIPIFDELYKSGKNIRLFIPRHEQGGTHAADGYARATGKIGVVIVTSGPGATNTTTAIANAHMDSIPLVLITGQVPTPKIGTDAFQEADITGITLPITKANFLINDVSELDNTLGKAFHIATTGRPGPVLVDVPVDIQYERTAPSHSRKIVLKSYTPKNSGHPKQIKTAIKLIKASEKPLVITGGGVNFSGSTALLNEFCDKFNVPVVTTLMGHGVNPKKEELFFGGIGMHGSLYGNYAIQNADLIIALGVRFSDRILGDPNSFAPQAKIIHVDIDPAEIGKNKDIHLPIVAHVKDVLKHFLNADQSSTDHSQWIAELQMQKEKYPLRYENSGLLKPQQLIQLANKYFPADTIIASDVGQNQMWVAQYFRFKHPRTLLTSGGLGTMGFALPAAIGAKIGNPDKEVLMIAGDGGFQMNIQELMTVNRYKLNIKMLVIDNRHLGMVRQWQELLCKKRYAGTVSEDNPDFAGIAKVIGIQAVTVNRTEEAEEVIKNLAMSKESMLVHALVDPEENVLPMVPPGKPLDQILTKI